MEKTKKVNPKKVVNAKKFAIFSIIIFILEKEKVPSPLVPTHLIYSINLTLFWSWQTVWDTKLLSWTNHQPKIKTCFNYCIAASKCASVCKFCRKMSGITLPRTLLLKKNTTSINRNKWNSFTVYINYKHNGLKLILQNQVQPIAYKLTTYSYANSYSSG